MSVIEFKLRGTDMVSFICQQVQESFNRATQLLEQAKAAPPWLRADIITNGGVGIAAVDEAVFVAHARTVGMVKFDAQVVESNARLTAGSLAGRRKEFADEKAFLQRRRHVLEAETMAVEAQILCAESLADEEVRRGLERPEGELQYLRGKEKVLRRRMDEMQEQINGCEHSQQDQPSQDQPL